MRVDVRKDMKIGEVRQKLHIMESELVAAEARLRGYVNKDRKMRKQLRFRLMMVGICVTTLLVFAIFLSQLLAFEGVDGLLLMVTLVLIGFLILVSGIMSLIFIIAAVIKGYQIWRNSDRKLAKKWSRHRGKENLSVVTLELEIRIAGYKEKQQQLRLIREDLLQKENLTARGELAREEMTVWEMDKIDKEKPEN